MPRTPWYDRELGWDHGCEGQLEPTEAFEQLWWLNYWLCCGIGCGRVCDPPCEHACYTACCKCVCQLAPPGNPVCQQVIACCCCRSILMVPPEDMPPCVCCSSLAAESEYSFFLHDLAITYALWWPYVVRYSMCRPRPYYTARSGPWP